VSRESGGGARKVDFAFQHPQKQLLVVLLDLRHASISNPSQNLPNPRPELILSRNYFMCQFAVSFLHTCF
jgi:hypothetical protein